MHTLKRHRKRVGKAVATTGKTKEGRVAEQHPSGATEQEEVVLTGAKTKPG